MAVYRSKVASKGRITIPLAMRKRLGINPGDEIEFDTRKRNPVIRVMKRRRNPFDKWKGRFGGFPGGIDEINAWIREMRGPI